MSGKTPEATTTISLAQLENLIRRVVREELARVLRSTTPSILDDWSQEGPDDPAGDEELLAEALITIEQYKKGDREGWKTLEEFEAEL
jgi:hypothetical protein